MFSVHIILLYGRNILVTIGKELRSQIKYVHKTLMDYLKKKDIYYK